MVTIVGGGIAGTVLAGALARHGHPATVYERQANPRNGQFLILDDRAHAALAGLGVPDDRLHAASHPLTALRVVADTSGVDATNEQIRPTENYRLYFRDNLMQVLDEFAHRAGAHRHAGVPITDIDPDTGTLVSGDTTVAGDEVVIAADGTDSIARARLEPGRQSEYAGQTVIYGTTTATVQPDSEPSVLHFHGGRGGSVVPANTFGHFWNDRIAVWFARITQPPLPTEQVGTRPATSWADAIRRATPDLGAPIDLMLADTEAVRVINARNVPLAGARPPRTPVILCGDADHAITPAGGVGARNAIEDVAALATALTSGADPAEAMADRRRQITDERAQIAQRYARERQ